MSEIEYVFGTGDGVVHIWSSEADVELARTGTADAVRLDFDGDGLADDVMWDSTGSGVADIAALDLDDDGVVDHFYTDPTGLGTWDHRITGTPEDASAEPFGWIVRTDPFPDSSSETNSGADIGSMTAPIERLPDAPARLWDPDELMDHGGLLPDQRGRLLDGCVTTDDY